MRNIDIKRKQDKLFRILQQKGTKRLSCSWLKYENELKMKKLLEPTARIKQLALPKLRHILSSKQNSSISDKQKENFNVLAKKSLFTIYTRLGKVSLPPKKNIIKWTKEDWELHDAWLKVRAKPKFRPEPKSLQIEKSGSKREPKKSCWRSLFEKKKVKWDTLILEELAEPKHITKKFNALKVESFYDPITKPKVLKMVDYSKNPWYNDLDKQLMRLKEYGLQKQKEIELEKCLKPKGPLKKPKQGEICENPNLDILVQYPNKTALEALEEEDKKRSEAEEHYRKTVDRKFLKIPASERTRALASVRDRHIALDFMEKEAYEAELERFRRAVNHPMTKKENEKYSKCLQPRGWLQKLTMREQNELKCAAKKYRNSSNRKYLEQMPSQRIIELAMLTEDLLEKHREWYDREWLNRHETYEKFFKTKPSALKYQMSKNSRLIKMATPKNPREKIVKSWQIQQT